MQLQKIDSMDFSELSRFRLLVVLSNVANIRRRRTWLKTIDTLIANANRCRSRARNRSTNRKGAV